MSCIASAHAGERQEEVSVWASSCGTQFTRFTSTKVQILTQQRCYASSSKSSCGTHFTCFTSAKVQILTQQRCYSRSSKSSSRGLADAGVGEAVDRVAQVLLVVRHHRLWAEDCRHQSEQGEYTELLQSHLRRLPQVKKKRTKNQRCGAELVACLP